LIVKRITIALQTSGLGHIKIQETGPQEISLSGEVGSSRDLETVKAIANREAKVSGKTITIEHIEIRRAPGEIPAPAKPPTERQVPPVEREQKGSIAPGPKQY
jgi:hypothetical protein